jgi:DNA-binding NtrC family response regulator
VSREFLAAAPATREILKTAHLVKGLQINVLITGERGSGKSLLAREILPNAAVADGEREEEIDELLLRADSLIIENFDRLARPDRLELEGKRIVATTARAMDSSVIDRFFGITLALPNLSERPEDVPLLTEAFLAEARQTLMVDRPLELAAINPDLSMNAHSMRRSIYSALLLDDVGESELVIMMEKFLREQLEESSSINIYRDFLYLYDRPLIEAGLKAYGSQLKLSSILGINRNTLRKKIYELGIEH